MLFAFAQRSAAFISARSNHAQFTSNRAATEPAQLSCVRLKFDMALAQCFLCLLALGDVLGGEEDHQLLRVGLKQVRR
jgi:hypothetical protein